MAVEADVDRGAQAAQAAGQGKRGISRRLMIIGGAAVGLLLALGVGSYFLLCGCRAIRRIAAVPRPSSSTCRP